MISILIYILYFVISSYERFERYRLRAMRAQIANQNAGHNRPPLAAIAQSGSPSHPNQLQLQNGPSQTTQTNQLPAPVNQLSLPSTSTDHSSKLDNQQKDDDNQSVDDDDELLDAVAEQTQVTQQERAFYTILCNIEQLSLAPN